MSSYALSTNGPCGFLDSSSTYLASETLEEISKDIFVIIIIIAKGKKQRATIRG